MLGGARNNTILVLFMAFLFVEFAMQPRLEKHYIYDYAEIERDDFDIIVGISTNFQTRNYVAFTMITKGPPYNLGLNVYIQNLDDYSTVRIIAATMQGNSNNENIELSNIPTPIIPFGTHRNPSGFHAGLYVKNLEFEPQPYEIEASIEICKLSQCHIEDVSVLLDYKVEYDFGFLLFDRILSV